MRVHLVAYAPAAIGLIDARKPHLCQRYRAARWTAATATAIAAIERAAANVVLVAYARPWRRARPEA